jgi:hypothetical protein
MDDSVQLFSSEKAMRAKVDGKKHHIVRRASLRATRADLTSSSASRLAAQKGLGCLALVSKSRNEWAS